MNYLEFLQSKSVKTEQIGFTSKKINPKLFPFQKFCVEKALKVGRFAFFEDCGLGKTIQQLEVASQCALHTGKPSLILAPLAVVGQTIKEGVNFEYDISEYPSNSPIQITNYEQLKNLDVSLFDCICLDESSILKNFQGKIKNQILESFKDTKYRFCFTATPSPNDLMELGNHSEFLGQMKFKNMLSMYFINDMDTVQKWRIKGHAEESFWKWVSTWSICVTNPKDIGFEIQGYNLPKLNMIPLQLETIERCLHLWSNEGDEVLTPFGGIGSEPDTSLKLNRRAYAIELKKSYFEQMQRNLENFIKKRYQLEMF